MTERFTYQEAYDASLEYFGGNELAANVFVGKYALRDNEGNYLEKTPKDMHRRLAKEFARIEEKKYKDTKIKPLTEDEIFDLLDEFKKIIPQGSPMYGIGNEFQYVSLGNCFSLAPPEDSYGGICRVDEEIVDNHNLCIAVLNRMWSNMYRDFERNDMTASENPSFELGSMEAPKLLDGARLTFTVEVPNTVISLCQ